MKLLIRICLVITFNRLVPLVDGLVHLNGLVDRVVLQVDAPGSQATTARRQLINNSRRAIQTMEKKNYTHLASY